MIRFFSQIRQKLILKDNVRKYLLYAVGEILLVVIGILIALQINNWNEAEKDQQFLNFALSELYADMSRDMALIFEGIEPRLKMKEQSTDSLLKMAVSDQPVSPEQFIEQYRGVSFGFNFTPVYGSYESLSRQGLDKIKDKELRKEIIDFYEFNLPRTVDFIHERDADLELYTQEQENQFLELSVISIGDLNPFVVKQLKEINNIFEHQVFLDLLDLHSNDAQNKRRRIESIKWRYNSLMHLLEMELDNRSVSFTRFDSTLVIPDLL